MKHLSLIISFILITACSEKSKRIKNISTATKPDTSFTTVKIALNILANDYKDVTAQRIVRDSTQVQTVDTTNSGEIIREVRPYKDTTYFAWWPMPVPDSTGKPKKNHLGGDSVIYKFIPLNKYIVIHDYNQRYK